MSGSTPKEPEREPRRSADVNWASAGKDDKSTGWVIISYQVAGMAIYGGLGWLIGQWVGAVRVTTLIGILVGLVLALTLVIYRYGRS